VRLTGSWLGEEELLLPLPLPLPPLLEPPVLEPPVLEPPLLEPPLLEPPVLLVPIPLRETLCGLPGTLSKMLSRAFSLTVVDGVNVTLMEQLAPAPSIAGELGQLLLCTKSWLFAPVSVMPLIVNA
jgi:hypothetical protein